MSVSRSGGGEPGQGGIEGSGGASSDRWRSGSVRAEMPGVVRLRGSTGGAGGRGMATGVGSGADANTGGAGTIISTAFHEYHSNNFFDSGPIALRLYDEAFPPPPTISVTNNYWGTTDPAEVGALIYDHLDDNSVTASALSAPCRRDQDRAA